MLQKGLLRVKIRENLLLHCMKPRIDSYRHRRDNADQQPDDEPGDYFVSARDGERFALVSGPYVNDHAAALRDVAECRRLVQTLDQWAAFYSFGTSRLRLASGKIGFLQRKKIWEILAE